MAFLKSHVSFRSSKDEDTGRSPLRVLMREFQELARSYETALQRSLAGWDFDWDLQWKKQIQSEARRLALTDLSTQYTRKHIRRSLVAEESLAKSAEERLHAATRAGEVERVEPDAEVGLGTITKGYFRLYSTELFDMLGQPTDLRFGTLRFHTPIDNSTPSSVELALNDSFFVAQSDETLPFHSFAVPSSPSLTNRGILSRKPKDNGAFPPYDSWLLFTFLGHGCLKLEVPIEMCADVYGGPLLGRENEEIVFWAIFVED
jgi:hypothetical protein